MRAMAICILLAAALVATFPVTAAEPSQPSGDKPDVLLLTGGEIHDHKGIGDLIQKYLEKDGRYDITRVENDLSVLEKPKLQFFDVLVFYWTLGELTEAQRSGLLDWVSNGGAFVTFHSGADSFRGDEAYRELVGGYFVGHPAYRMYQVSVKDREHPITKGIDEFFTTDEQYYLNYNEEDIHVLANALHKGGLMPVMWVKDYGEGKVHYNALCHDAKATAQPMTRKLIQRSVAWAAGLPTEPTAKEAEASAE